MTGVINAVDFLRNKTENNIYIVINNVSYSNFLSINISRSLETIANQFTITLSLESIAKLPFKLGDSVSIYFDKTPLITGYVEVLSATYSTNTHYATISGRDKTADIIDSSIETPVSITGSISLVDLIKNILESNNINDIDVKSNVDIDLFTANDQVTVDNGDSIFNIIDEYCLKRQVIATTSGAGDILLTRVDQNGESYTTKLVHRSNAVSNSVIGRSGLSSLVNKTSENNIISATYTLSTVNKFSKYVVKTQDILKELNLPSIDRLNKTAIKEDNTARGGRTMVIPSDNTRDLETAQNRANWELSANKSKEAVYQCQVAGFIPEKDKVWTPNTLIKVEDERHSIDDYMIIKNVDIMYSLDSGSLTNLELIKKDSYQS